MFAGAFNRRIKKMSRDPLNNNNISLQLSGSQAQYLHFMKHREMGAGGGDKPSNRMGGCGSLTIEVYTGQSMAIHELHATLDTQLDIMSMDTR